MAAPAWRLSHGQANGNGIGIIDPPDGKGAEENIADCAAPDARDKGDERDPKQVHIIAQGRQGTRNGKHKKADSAYREEDFQCSLRHINHAIRVRSKREEKFSEP